MGSSSGGNYQMPNTPAPPNTIPFGQSAPYSPRFTNFLPDDPNAMATGLTPGMLASIGQNAAPPPQPAWSPPPARAAPAGPSPQQIQDMRNQMAATMMMQGAPSYRGLTSGLGNQYLGGTWPGGRG